MNDPGACGRQIQPNVNRDDLIVERNPPFFSEGGFLVFGTDNRN